MKKLFNVLILVLAINFLAVLGGVGALFTTGKLDREKANAIRQLMFSSTQPADPAAAAATQPSTKPTSAIDELLSKYSGRRAGEQVEVIQQSIDAQSAALDRRNRELENLMQQILREKAELAQKSASLDTDKQKLLEQQQQQVSLASDKGFQDSLKLYGAMSGKQTKAAFMAMPDDAVVRYLQSMPPRTANKVIKEFKSPEEQDRINRVLEKMRLASAATQPTGEAASASSLQANPTAPLGTDRPPRPAPPRE